MTLSTAAVKPTTSAAKTASATTNQHNFMKKASATVDDAPDYAGPYAQQNRVQNNATDQGTIINSTSPINLELGSAEKRRKWPEYQDNINATNSTLEQN